MSKQVSIILHLNTDYAEIPRKKLREVVETSYNPILEHISTLENVKIGFNITGHSIDYLEKNHPETIEKIKELVKTNFLEPLLTGYSHPILPLLPLKRAEKQLKDHYNKIKQVFDFAPTGFWPPELAVSPYVLDLAKNLGINWVAIDAEHFQLSQYFGNEYNPFEKREKTMTEILADAYWAKGISKITKYLNAKNQMVEKLKQLPDSLKSCKTANSNQINCYLTSNPWTTATHLVLSNAVPSILFNEKKLIKIIQKHSSQLLPIYASDIEFFGYRELGMDPIPPKKLTEFISKLQNKSITITTPSEIPKEQWKQTPYYIRTGSWAPDNSLNIWTESEDNKELTRRLSEVYSKLQQNDWNEEIINEIENDLRIAENSDARGWSPLPERKQEAYEAIARIIAQLE